MATVIRKDSFILREDIWFDEKPEIIPHVDVRYFYYQSTIPAVPDIEFEKVHTLLIDLTQDEEKIWQKINRKNRYKIRQAMQKDQIIFEFFGKGNSEILDEFINFYIRFSAQQGSTRRLVTHEISRLKAYMNAGYLYFSRVKSREGNPLTWQVYCHDKTHVFSLHKALIRQENDVSSNQMLGQINRYHHWQDILKFKSLGFLIYDLGGVFTNTQDPKLLNINKFKAEFGGELIQYFNCRCGITYKGKLYLFLRQFLTNQV